LRHDRDFRAYWAGQSLSLLGSQVTAVGLPLIAALTLDVGAGGVSLIATAFFLPNLLLPLLAGHWLEGRPKRPVMIWADITRALLLATVPIASVTGVLSLPLLTGVAFSIGAMSVVFDIGGFTYLPTLVRRNELAEANRALQGSATVAQVGGPGLAGVLVQLVGPPLALFADALSYLASVFGVAAARRPEPRLRTHPSGGLLEGVRLLTADGCLRALTAHAAIYNAAAQIVLVNLVIWAVDDRHVAPGLYGLALSAAGAGAFLGTMAALRGADRLGYGHAFLAALSLSCGVPLLTATFPWQGATLALGFALVQFVSGIGLGCANVLSTTLRQTIIPTTQLARTTGAYRLFMFGSIPLGSALGGVLGESFDSRIGVALGTLGLALSALPMLAPRIRTLRNPNDIRVASRAQVSRPSP
jgi:MFS family permease